MVPAARWLIVAAVAVGLAAAPSLVRAIPPQQSGIGASALAERIRDAHDRGWSGEVVAQGALEVPIDDDAFQSVARLLGERSELRVWWRDATSWRVDRIRATGETDLVRDGGLTARWTYEGQRVRFTPYSPVRLPSDVDVVPAELAHRLLAGARKAELRRLPARRIAGHSAAGLRLTPSDPRSTIERVDVWADVRTGVALQVDVYGDSQQRPVLTTRLTSLSLDRPARDDVELPLSPQVDASRGVALDDAAGANVFAPFVPPDSVAGLARRGQVDDLGAVGIYGRGPTAVVAIPLRDFVARGLREQLRKSPRAREEGPRIALEVGPVSILLADVLDGYYLLGGTVTPQTLLDAADDLATGVRRVERR